MTGACDNTRRLRLCHRADPTELRSIRRSVERWAQENAVSGDALIDLQLALGEAVSNGVEHAYRGTTVDDPTVDVDLEIRTVPAGSAPVVVVRVADHGRWQPIPVLSGYRGRGLAMIQMLAEDMRVSRSRAGTQVCFEIPIHR